jgi:serine/threonine protein kinase
VITSLSMLQGIRQEEEAGIRQAQDHHSKIMTIIFDYIIPRQKQELDIQVQKELKSRQDQDKDKELAKLPSIVGQCLISTSKSLVLAMTPIGIESRMYLIKSEIKEREEILIRWSKELFSFMRFVHSKGLVHGDIKPQNIVIVSQADPSTVTNVNEQVIVIDWGSCGFAGGFRELETPNYAPDNPRSRCFLDFEGDIDSLYRSLYSLYIGDEVFQKLNADNQHPLLTSEIKKTVFIQRLMSGL